VVVGKSYRDRLGKMPSKLNEDYSDEFLFDKQAENLAGALVDKF
jgi:hypothetical protein